MTNSYNLPKSGKFILIRGGNSYVLVGKAGRPFALCIEAPDGEVCQGLSGEDIIAVSAPEGGPLEPAVMLLELVRLYRSPLVVLPADHPGSARLRYIVSAGQTIRLSCSVRRGTHPEQDILCGSSELSGMCLRAVSGGIEIVGISGEYSVSYISYEFSLLHEPLLSASPEYPGA
ncbi:MAG TPA: alpha/beta hydrolase [Methanoregulaceae archaeon]|nr:alpha/beta hydrolase [Methanoregulaceae archaeon]